MTIKTVAEFAGVSVATVSNYINQTRPVSREKAEKIAFTIEKLNYTPNQSARSMKSGKSRKIGLILPNIKDPFYVQVFEGVLCEMEENGYSVCLELCKDIPEIEERCVQRLLEERVSGVAIVSSQPGNRKFFIDKFQRNDIPIVGIERRIQADFADFAGFENETTIHRITCALLNSGKKNIVLMAGPQNFSSEQEAVKGYLSAYEEMNISCSKQNILFTRLNKESAFRCIIRHLSQKRPQAIITTSKLVTLGVTEAISVNGLEFPGDVLVATLGEDSWNRFYNSQNVIATSREATRLGKEAGGILLSRINGDCKNRRELLLQDKFSNIQSVSTNQHNHGKIRAVMLDTAQVGLFSGLLPRFKQLTGVDVEITKIKHENLLEDIETKQCYDVIMFDLPWLFSLASDGKLADITDEISRRVDTSAYLKNCIDVFGMYANRYYGLPFTYAPQILFYNKEIFEDRQLANLFYKIHKLKLRPPKSFAEFNLTANFLTKSANDLSPTKYGTAIPVQYKECLLPELYMRMRAYGAEVFNSKGEVVFDSPQTIKACANLLDLIKTASPTHLNLNDMNVVDEFLNGDIAMLITYPSFITGIHDIQRKTQLGKIGYSHIPGKAPILGGWSLGVSAFSKNKDIAFDFVQWATGADIANYSAIMAGQSAMTSTFDNNELKDLYPWLSIYKEAYDFASPIIPPKKSDGGIVSQNKIDNIIFEQLYLHMSGVKELVDAIGDAHKELCKIIRA